MQHTFVGDVSVGVSFVFGKKLFSQADPQNPLFSNRLIQARSCKMLCALMSLKWHLLLERMVCIWCFGRRCKPRTFGVAVAPASRAQSLRRMIGLCLTKVVVLLPLINYCLWKVISLLRSPGRAVLREDRTMSTEQTWKCLRILICYFGCLIRGWK